DEAIQALADLARERSMEVWLSAQTRGSAMDTRGAGPDHIPPPLDKFYGRASVIVFLQPEGNIARLRLLKDHDATDLSDLHLRLDSHTMRVVDEDIPPPSERPKDTRRFRLLSGGARGAEAEFGACAETWGMTEVNYSFEGHRLRERKRGVIMLSSEDLVK